jgi:alkylation response protein AidB-like acyl-CoA dehydrogenase
MLPARDVPAPPLLAAAERLSHELLAPAAAAVEAQGRVPRGHLDALAAAGLHGIVGPRDAGGAGGDLALLSAVAERLAAGCLSTTFVWLQHHGAVGAVVAAEDDALRARWLAPLCRGTVRAGVAFSALRRPGPPAMTAVREGGDWRLDGSAPWVTGFEQAAVLRLAARERGSSDVVWLLADAAPAPTLRAAPVHPVAADAADTVTLTLEGHRVPGDRLLRTEPFEAWREADRRPAALRANGSLALGVARRCVAALEDEGNARAGEARAALTRTRAALDAAETTAAMAAARAAASDLALRLARTLVVVRGGRGIVQGELAERTAREALFLLVFGQAPAIRAAQLAGPVA